MDYHIIGFRECASEVARYLVAIEGLDLQDPLRVRLTSHLQCYSAQRELSLKTSIPSSIPWSATPAPNNFNQYSASMGPLPGNSGQDHHGQSTYNCSEPRLSGHQELTPRMDNALQRIGGGHQELPRLGGHQDNAFGQYGRVNPTGAGGPHHSSSMALVQQPTPGLAQMQGGSNPPQYHPGFASGGYGSGGAFNQHASATGRPYRPWGAELAY